VSRPSGILLAGGASRRFGRPKLVEPLDGVPLFHWPLWALVDSCDDVLIVLGPDAAALHLPPGSDRVRFVRDDVAYEGPLAGTRVGLESVRRDHAVLVAADMPGVTPRLLSLMAERAAKAARAAVVLNDADGPRPLPAVVTVAPALALARSLLESGERRLRALIDGLDPLGLPPALWSTVDPDGAWRHDVDVPDDLGRGRR
jgi:molybdopterin-guanine dinucleotide biosynthesis protein A